MNKFAKVLVLALLSVAVVAPSAFAQTSDIQAQIQALLAQIQALQAQAGASAGASAYTYTSNLTVGSKGADVTALQNFLSSKGFLKVAATGFFGPMTKAALAAYQKSVGISPAVGYFGPVTRAHFNSVAVVPVPTPTPTPTPNPSTPSMTKTEGNITVQLNPTPASGQQVYEGSTKTALIGLKIKATGGDVNVQRVKVDLGTATTLYSKFLSMLYVVDDAGNVLTSQALNSSTVVKDGSNYVVYLTGFNFLVPKDTTKVLTISGDMYNTIDSADVTANPSLTVTIDTNGVRGVDGLGLQQEGPSSGTLSRSFAPLKNQATTATLTISKDGNSPKAGNVVSDTNGNISSPNSAVLLAMDLRSTKDQIKVTDFVATATGSIYPSTLYAYDGSTLVGSASVDATTHAATFSNMEFYVPAGAVKVITFKGDYTGVSNTAATSYVTVGTYGFSAQNSRGDTMSTACSTATCLQGSATGETMTVIKKGAVFALSSAAALTTQNTAGANATPTYKGIGSFTITVSAAGGDIYLSDSTSTNLVYATSVSGASSGSAAANTSLVVTGYNTYSGGIYKIAQDTTATITVKGEIPSSVTSGSYMMFVKNIIWSTDSGLASPVTTTFDNSIYKSAGAGVTLP